MGSPLSGGAAILVAMALAVGLLAAVAIGPSGGDAEQLEPATRAVLSGHLDRAYPVSVNATSPPGYPIVAAVPTWILDRAVSDGYLWTGFLILPALLAAAAFLGHRSTAPWGTRAGAVVLLGTLFGPGVLQSLVDLYHPQDLLALALLLVAIAWCPLGEGDGGGRRLALSASCAGFACATRQWALLPAAMLPVDLPDARVRFTAVAGAVAAAVTAPFLLADPAGLVTALRAVKIVKATTVVGRLPLADGQIALVARVGPLLATGALVLLVVLRRGRARMSPIARESVVLGALAAVVARLVFEPVLYPYYLAPAAVLGVLWGAASARRLLGVALAAAVVVNLRDLAIGTDQLATVSAILLELMLVAVLAVTAVRLWRDLDRRTPAPSSV
jgi:hypothetical protein